MRRTTRATASVLVLCAAIPLTALAQQTRSDVAEAESLFATCVMPDRPGGFSVASVQDSQVLFRAFSGTANAEHGVPITATTRFDFASVAKQFTGFAIASLVDQGLVSLADDIRRYLPEMHDFGEPITVAHLLYHTSGLRDWVGLVKLCGHHEADAITGALILNLASQQRELNFQPGERFLYSNTGYCLLAEIVARVSGQSFRDWAEQNILAPLGMADTVFHDDCQEIVTGRASSYRPRPKGGWLNSSSNAAVIGSSSLLSTVDDMAKWVANFGTRSIGSDRVWEMMLTSGTLDDGQKIDYGFGLWFGVFDGKATVGHGGSWAGTVSQITYFPEEQFGFVFVANRDPFEVFVEHDLCRIFLGGATARSSARTTPGAQGSIAVSPAMAASYSGWYRKGRDVIKIVRLGDGLAAVLLPWELTFRLHPLSSTSFRIDELETTYTFSGPQEAPRLWAYYADGGDVYERMQTEISGIDDVVDVCGEYYSDELCTTYRIEVRDGHLVVTHPENEPVLLARLDKDCYLGDRWWFTEVNLLRDEAGKVSGILVNADQGNVRNLRLVKR